MTFEEKLDRLDGIYAWDCGCLDSGIKDDDFKRFLNQNLEELHPLLTALARQYMKDEAYDFSAMYELVGWAKREFDCYL